jgi:hypothetical protein
VWYFGEKKDFKGFLSFLKNLLRTLLLKSTTTERFDCLTFLKKKFDFSKNLKRFLVNL